MVVVVGFGGVGGGVALGGEVEEAVAEAGGADADGVGVGVEHTEPTLYQYNVRIHNVGIKSDQHKR